MPFIERSEMVNQLIESFPIYLRNEDKYTKMKFLTNHYGCNCTDCNGDDSINECKIEFAYFQMEKVIQHTEL